MQVLVEQEAEDLEEEQECAGHACQANMTEICEVSDWNPWAIPTEDNTHKRQHVQALLNLQGILLTGQDSLSLALHSSLIDFIILCFCVKIMRKAENQWVSRIKWDLTGMDAKAFLVG